MAIAFTWRLAAASSLRKQRRFLPKRRFTGGLDGGTMLFSVEQTRVGFWCSFSSGNNKDGFE